MASKASGRVVQVINLGRMGFLQAYDVQRRYALKHLDWLSGISTQEAKDTLLLVEHNPVYTIGIRRNQYDAFDEQRLKQLGAQFYRTNRGGLITFHGPGQLVAYPIFNLHHFRLNMRKYVSALEMTVINACRRFGIEARTTADTGVWIKDQKIAAIGVQGSRYITTHGVSLNCNTDLTWFRHIVPCGIPDKGVTSLSKELNRNISIQTAVKPFISAFEEEFDCQLEFYMFDSGDNSFMQWEDHSVDGTNTSATISPSLMQTSQQSLSTLSTSASSAAGTTDWPIPGELTWFPQRPKRALIH